MNRDDLERLNRRNRMTPEERDHDMVRETFGPLFDAFFGVPMPQNPNPDNLPEGCPGCRETLDGKLECCQVQA